MDKNRNAHKAYIVSLMRVFFVLFSALVLPRFFFQNEKVQINNSSAPALLAQGGFKLGLENISSDFLENLSTINKSGSYSAGLITNHTGLDQYGNRTIDILLAKGIPVKKIYVPEDDLPSYHKNVKSEAISVPIVPLPHAESLHKNKEYAFKDIDVLFFDIQDNGMNPNIHLATLLKALKSAASHDKAFVVLDRPNVMGAMMEGIFTKSGISEELLSLPMRHGMTCGELAQYYNATLLSHAARLFIVPMQNYRRVSIDEEITSAHNNMFTAIDVYYGSGFLHVLNSVEPLDIGIGTDMAFQCVTLPEYMKFPKQKWFELRAILKKHGITTSWCRYINHKKQLSYAGLRLMIKNVDQVSSFATVLSILNFFKESGVRLTYAPQFDLEFGGGRVREFLGGKFSRHDLEYEINKSLKTFYNKAQNFFIYKPAPRIVLL